MQKKRKKQKLISCFMLFVVAAMLAAGCGKPGTGTETETRKEKTIDESVAMGRYVEEVTDLSEQMSGYNSISCLDDGSLIITDQYLDFLKSTDNGTTWEADDRGWLTKMIEKETYILSMAVGGDNTVAVIYNNQDALPEDTKEDEYMFNPVLMLIKPDGMEIPVTVALSEEEKYLSDVFISESGRIFVSAMGGSSIYEVREDGSSERFLTVNGYGPDMIQFLGNLMILDGYDYDGLLIYDMEKEEYIEDEVLSEFVNANYKDRRYDNNWMDFYFFPGEENVLYVAGKMGLYRHVIGGSAMEQVIDGKLCTFNNPAYGLLGMVPLKNNEFLALFSGGRLVRFSYDPNVPTVPSETLKVYSLKENDLIRQATTLYQSANPEVFVEYEIGIEEGGAVTREDALKKLNTRIMAGDGPDVLVLDDMPIDSYVEKGMLADMNAMLNQLSGEDELFGNIVDAFKIEDKIYTLPCEIQLPILLGEESCISDMNDLTGIADGIEKLRAENPEKDIIRICTEKGVMRMFAMSCVPTWKTEDGKLDESVITEFLTQTKRIYEAQMDGIPEELIENYNRLNESYLQDMGVSRDDSDYLRIYSDELGYIGGRSLLVCGAMTYPYEYAQKTSVDKAKGFENSKLVPMNGQSKNVFVAKTLVGISAASNAKEKARDFLKVLFGKENQSSLFAGFAINKAAFENNFVIKESEIDEDGVYGWQSFADDSGVVVEMAVYWPSKEQINALESRMEALNTPYIEDDVLEAAVYEAGTSYMRGEISLSEAVDAIEKKMSLYMAE